MIRVGIIGGAGYTGGELLRLLLHHPQVTIAYVNSHSQHGKLVSSVHKDLVAQTNLLFSNELSKECDILFLCLGHGESKKWLQEHKTEISDTTKVIDLSQDFRLIESNTADNRIFTYGLPELQREKIKNAQNIANPGCFATALQIGLLPLAQLGLLKDVHSVGITGSTGAGQSLTSTNHFSWRSNNIQAYKSLEHQHLKEVCQSLHSLQPLFSNDPNQAPIYFVPWRGDFTRGIFVSSIVHISMSLEELQAHYENYYGPHPFTFFSKEPIDLKQVVNTNFAFVQIEKRGDTFVIHSIIDNLLKGACGQAVQNMNIMLGMKEDTGLKLKATGF